MIPLVEQLRSMAPWVCFRGFPDGPKSDRNGFLRERLNFEARYGFWPRQSSDGKRSSALSGQNAFPWLEVSDSRRVVIGESVDEDVEYLMKISDSLGCPGGVGRSNFGAKCWR